MNGPAHYAEAEALLRNAAQLIERATEHTFVEAATTANTLARIALGHAQLAAVAAHLNTKSPAEFPLAMAPDFNADLTWKDVI